MVGGTRSQGWIRFFKRAVLIALMLGASLAQAHDFGGQSDGGDEDPPPSWPPCDDGVGCCPMPGGRSGSPISYFNGSESIAETDLLVSGVFPIALTRKYDSLSTYDSPLGYGWSFLIDRRLYEYPDGSVVVRHGCGMRDRYVLSGGSYVSPTGGMLGTLSAESGGNWKLRFADGETDFFDSQGRLTAIQNVRGDRLEFTYDARGKLPLTGSSKQAIDPNNPMVVAYVFRLTRIAERAADGTLTGHYVDLSYSEDTGRLTGASAHDGRSISYQHDVTGVLTKGNLIGVAGVGGIARTYGYTDPLDPHNLTSIIDAPGRVAVINTYDSNDRVIRQEEGPRRIEFNYQIPLTKTVVTKTVVDENGLNSYTSATTYEFDTTGRITKILDPFGHETRFLYNASKRLAQKQIWQNNSGTLALLLSRNWSYDASGHKQTEYVTLDSGESITRSWTYNGDWVASEQVVSSATPGKIFRTEYTFNLGPDGKPQSIQSTKRRRDDGSFQTVSYQYDAQNRLTRKTLPDGVVLVNEYTSDDLTRTYIEVGGIEIPQLERRFEYDARGLLTKQWDARNNLTQFAYDDRGRLSSIVNPLGQETKYTFTGDLLFEVEVGRTVADGEGQITRFLYDDQGRQAAIQRKNDSGAYVTFGSFAYDSEGRAVKVTDAAGRMTRYGYDREGRVNSITDPDNRVVQYTYDAAGRRIRALAPLGREVEVEYDDMGRRIAVVQKGVTPNLRTEMVYDAVGNKVRHTDARNNSTEYTYDALSRLTSVTRPLGQQSQIFYDNRDRVDYLMNSRGQKVDLSYLPWGPLQLQQYFASASAPSPQRTIAYTYDEDGNVLSISDDGIQAGTSYEYSHDALSRVLDETIKYLPGGDRVLQRRFDRFGNRRELTLQDGGSIASTYTYNKLNELIGANLAGHSFSATYRPDSRLDVATLSGTITRDLGYDTRGLIDSIVASGPGGAISQLSYLYDEAARVDTYTDDDGVHDPSYDALDRLTSVTHPAASALPLTETFGFDATGNRENPSNPNDYQYDANNRLTAAPGLTYSGDADGNVSSSSDGRAFGHDLLNRLVSFTLGATTAEYLYDFSGRRIRKTVGGQPTWYLWDGARLTAEYNSAGARTARYSYVGMAFAAAQYTDTNGTYWIHTDQLGTARLLTNASGTPVWEARYTAFGTAIIDADPDANGQQVAFRMRLPGQYEDAESGLYYNLARYYDPSLGRYLEEDPLPSSNQYAYANGNPFSFIDPLGLTVYKYPPNNYSDRRPPPGTPCEKAIFRRGLLLGWEPCDSCSGGSGGPPGTEGGGPGDGSGGPGGPPNNDDSNDESDNEDDRGPDDDGIDDDDDKCSPVRQFIDDHLGGTFTFDIGRGWGVSGQVSIGSGGINGYIGLGVGIGAGVSVTGDFAVGDTSGFGGNISAAGGNGIWGGYVSNSFNDEGMSGGGFGVGRGIGVGAAATFGYSGNIVKWGPCQ